MNELENNADQAEADGGNLKTWCAEFYFVSADEAAQTMDAVGLVEHSLTKWRGLLPENLEKHDVQINSFVQVEDHRGKCLPIHGGTCSLCCKYGKDYVGCGDCPLYLLEGDCTGNTRWVTWRRNHDPKPMIEALERTLAYVKNKQEN